jgi:hypothetical protein
MTVKQDIATGSLSDCTPGMILESVITCPHCGTAKAEIMPTDACRYLYDCTGCGARLWAKAGDCCVFCSYGTVPCPPIQAARVGETASCCTADSRPAMSSASTAKTPRRRHFLLAAAQLRKRRLKSLR